MVEICQWWLVRIRSGLHVFSVKCWYLWLRIIFSVHRSPFINFSYSLCVWSTCLCRLLTKFLSQHATQHFITRGSLCIWSWMNASSREISQKVLDIVKYLLVHDNNWCAFLASCTCLANYSLAVVFTNGGRSFPTFIEVPTDHYDVASIRPIMRRLPPIL